MQECIGGELVGNQLAGMDLALAEIEGREQSFDGVPNGRD
jgi:hypothetical protein